MPFFSSFFPINDAFFPPCSLFWKLLLANPRIHAAARPLISRPHLSRSCWIRTGVKRREKRDGAADHTPASPQETHFTPPVCFRDKASSQTWLRRLDKRRASRDYARHRLRRCFRFHSTKVDWGEPTFPSWSLHPGFRDPHTHTSSSHCIYKTDVVE